MTVQKKLMLGVGTGVLLIAGVLYETVLPNHYANTYNQKMRTDTVALHASLDRTSETTSRAIFTKDDTTLETNQVDIKAIQKQITESKHEVAHFETTAASLKSLPLSGYFGGYHTAKAVKVTALSVAHKASSGLAVYDRVIAHMDKSFAIDAKYQKQFTDFSALTNVTPEQTIAGLKANAQVIRKAIAEHQALKAPAEIYNGTEEFALNLKTADALESEAAAMEKGDNAAANKQWEAVNDLGRQIQVAMKQSNTDFRAKSTFFKTVNALPKLTQQIKL